MLLLDADSYVQWLAHAGAQYGLQPVVFNARGCGGSTLRTPRMFHAARTEDMECVVAHVRERVGPQAKVFAVGVSLGAGILVTYLARHGHQTGLHAAGGCHPPLPFSLAPGVERRSPRCSGRTPSPYQLPAPSPRLPCSTAALAGSYDFFETSRRLERGLNKVLYNHHLANSLKRFLARHAKVFQVRSLHRAREELLVRADAHPTRSFLPQSHPTPLDLDAVARGRTVRDFDASVVVPMVRRHAHDGDGFLALYVGGCAPMCWWPIIHVLFLSSSPTPQFGFRDTDHYYAESSPGQSLPEVKIPLLVINARNDPIADIAGLDELAPVAQRNPNVRCKQRGLQGPASEAPFARAGGHSHYGGRRPRRVAHGLAPHRKELGRRRCLPLVHRPSALSIKRRRSFPGRW